MQELAFSCYNATYATVNIYYVYLPQPDPEELVTQFYWAADESLRKTKITDASQLIPVVINGYNILYSKTSTGVPRVMGVADNENNTIVLNPVLPDTTGDIYVESTTTIPVTINVSPTSALFNLSIAEDGSANHTLTQADFTNGSATISLSMEYSATFVFTSANFATVTIAKSLSELQANPVLDVPLYTPVSLTLNVKPVSAKFYNYVEGTYCEVGVSNLGMEVSGDKLTYSWSDLNAAGGLTISFTSNSDPNFTSYSVVKTQEELLANSIVEVELYELPESRAEIRYEDKKAPIYLGSSLLPRAYFGDKIAVGEKPTGYTAVADAPSSAPAEEVSASLNEEEI